MDAAAARARPIESAWSAATPPAARKNIRRFMANLLQLAI
jgi:ABC-type transporter lipoprotein component MlaA